MTGAAPWAARDSLAWAYSNGVHVIYGGTQYGGYGLYYGDLWASTDDGASWVKAANSTQLGEFSNTAVVFDPYGFLYMFGGENSSTGENGYNWVPVEGRSTVQLGSLAYLQAALSSSPPGQGSSSSAPAPVASSSSAAATVASSSSAAPALGSSSSLSAGAAASSSSAMAALSSSAAGSSTAAAPATAASSSLSSIGQSPTAGLSSTSAPLPSPTPSSSSSSSPALVRVNSAPAAAAASLLAAVIAAACCALSVALML